MRFAVTGCGEVAQIMHIPHVVEHPALELHALVDPDDDRLDVLGDRYGVEHRYQGVDPMIDAVGTDLDAVVVCTPMHTHAEVGVAVLQAGLHVLLEKPLAMTPEGADALVDAAGKTDATAMVGYMKRYAEAYQRAASLVDDLSAVDLITAFDTDPDFPAVLAETYDLVDADLPDEFVEESAAARRRRAMAAIDAEDPDLADAYDFHLEHVCHDVNALRGLFGAVERIQHVDFFADGRYGTAMLEYEGGQRCTLTSGIGDRAWFDQYIRVDAPEGMVTLEFGNPMVRNHVPRVVVTQGRDELEETVLTPTYEESFKRELDHFVRCIRGEAAVRTPFEHARADVELVADLFRAYQGKPLVGGS